MKKGIRNFPTTIIVQYYGFLCYNSSAKRTLYVCELYVCVSRYQRINCHEMVWLSKIGWFTYVHGDSNTNYCTIPACIILSSLYILQENIRKAVVCTNLLIVVIKDGLFGRRTSESLSSSSSSRTLCICELYNVCVIGNRTK